MNTPHSSRPKQSAGLLLAAIMALSVVGFVVGINDGVPSYDDGFGDRQPLPAAAEGDSGSGAAMPALEYGEMRRMETGPTSQWAASLQLIHAGDEYRRCVMCHDPHTLQVGPSEEDKRQSLATRSERRAFNGAPPVIPHNVERTDDAACYACHGQGAMVGDRVAYRMSHRYLANCLQCHAEPPPKPFAHLEAAVASSFAGLPAPPAGERAFPGAPPVIPHSTWMRENCLSCHGGVVGWPGLQVTHRWRTNCTQCHAVSAKFEQAVVREAGDRLQLGEFLQP